MTPNLMCTPWPLRALCIDEGGEVLHPIPTAWSSGEMPSATFSARISTYVPSSIPIDPEFVTEVQTATFDDEGRFRF
jgi:hypothetical protein